MFERFTELARRVIVLAQEEARGLRHDYIGTEHLLLGLLRVRAGVAARVLEGLDVTIEEARAQVDRLIGRGDELPAGQIPFTPRAKKVLELSLREAVTLGHSHISTEHVLLGLVRESGGVGARILLDFDADYDTIRRGVLAELSGRTSAARHSVPFETEGEELAIEIHPRAGSGWSEYPTAPSASVPWHVRRPAALLVAIVLAAAGFPLGLLVGFLIWG